MELRGEHKSYLDAADCFMTVEEDLNSLDGCCVVEDSSRGTILRAGATEQGFQNRQKEHHKVSLLRASVGKQRRFFLLCPDESVAKNVEDRSGSFQNLKQRVGTGMERAKQDAFLSLL